jgi:uncharacterized protein (DUF433 family)
MSTSYLSRKPKSVYRQLFIKERWVSARTLYGMYVNEEAPMTPEEIAADYDLPLEAVLEAIAYCESNPPEIAQDYAREEALMEATGMNHPDCKYHQQPETRSHSAGHRTCHYQAVSRRGADSGSVHGVESLAVATRTDRLKQQKNPTHPLS